MGCLADDAVVALVSGTLSDVDRDECDAHLDECADCRALVAASMPRGDHDSIVLRPGTHVGRFVVTRLIGSGAMGAVYEAHDPELHRSVAIKMVRAEKISASAQNRLLSEARAMAKLSHPNVVHVYDVGTHGESVYLAMEFVDGHTLTEWLKTSRHPIEVATLLSKAARGMAAAHDAGLIHRDFKPDNVFVASDGQVRVGDFGLSTPLEHASSSVAGTPAYMAPELERRKSGDAKADQFSVAMVLAEALRGERPPAGRSPSSAGFPRRLAAIVDRAGAERPDDRYPSMTTLADALADSTRPRRWPIYAGAGLLFAGLAVFALTRGHAPACNDGQTRIAQVYSQDTRKTIAASFAATGLPYAQAVATASLEHLDAWSQQWAKTHDRICRDTRVHRRQSESVQAEQNACLDRHAAGLRALVDEFQRIGPEQIDTALAASTSLPDLAECLDTSALGQEKRPDEKRELIDKLERELAVAKAGIAAGALQRVERELPALVERAKSSGHEATGIRAELMFAELSFAKGELDKAEQGAHDALLRATSAGHDRQMAESWLLLSSIAGTDARYAEAETRAEQAAAVLKRLAEPGRLATELLTLRGLVAYNANRNEEALRLLSSALEKNRALYGDSDPRVARAHTNLGNALRVADRFDDALAHHQKAKDIDERVLGPTHPVQGRHLHNMAGVWRRRGELSRAFALYQEALAHKRKSFGAEHAELALTQNSLGLVAHARKDFEGATDYFAKAAAIFEKKKHGHLALALMNLGIAELARGNHQAAELSLMRARAMYQSQGAAQELQTIDAALAELPSSAPKKRAPAAKGRPVGEAKPPIEGPDKTEKVPALAPKTPSIVDLKPGALPPKPKRDAPKPDAGPVPTYGSGQAWK